MKRKNNKYEEFLCEEGYSRTFPKKDARVLFKTKHGKIIDLIVEDFPTPDHKKYLYQEYSQDIGNCLSDWNEWSFSDVLIKIFVSYQVDYELRKKILFELSKVEEWRPSVSHWIYRNWKN